MHATVPYQISNSALSHLLSSERYEEALLFSNEIRQNTFYVSVYANPSTNQYKEQVGYLQMLLLRDQQGLEVQKIHYSQEDIFENLDLYGWTSGKDSEHREA